MRRILGFLTLTFLSTMVFAEVVTCKNDNGSCEFNEDGSYECLCSEDSYGEGTGVAGSGDSIGEAEMPTQEECLVMIDDMCALPEGAVTCENPAGECVVLENGSYWCDCLDGSGTGGGDSEPGDPGEEPSIDPDDSEDDTPSVDGDDETEPVAEECESSLDCREGLICVDGYCVGKDGETPEEEMPVCEDVLKETCGTEAPDINEICSEDALKVCSDGIAIYFEKCEDEEIPADLIQEVKEGTWNEIASDVADCCNGYEESKEETTTLIDCLRTKTCEECMKVYEEAVGEDYGDSGSQAGDDVGDTGDTANEDGTQTSEDPKDSTSDSSDGCSLTLI